MTSSSDAGARLPIASLIKSLRVLEELALSGGNASVADLIERSGLERTTVQRVLRTLQAESYIERTARGEYSVAARGYVLGAMLAGSNHLTSAATPVLTDLQKKTAETVHLGVLGGTDAVSIAYYPSGRILSFTFPMGTRIPAYASTLGRAILAHVPTETAIDVLQRSDRKALTRETLTSMKDLRRELERVRGQGYCAGADEVELGIASIAAPVIGPTGHALAAMNNVMPNLHLEERGGKDAFLPDLLAAARKLSAQMGWTGSIPV